MESYLHWLAIAKTHHIGSKSIIKVFENISSIQQKIALIEQDPLVIATHTVSKA